MKRSRHTGRRAMLGALAATAVAVFVGMAVGTSSTATAADTQPLYCLNGTTTTMPAEIYASSETAGDLTALIDEGFVAMILSHSSGGLFWVGYAPSYDDWDWLTPDYGISPADYFEAGYSTNTVGYGKCAPPPITHVGVCKMLKRGDGTTGMFQEITVAQWNDKNGQYYDAVAANWVEGLGLTCDNPIALGYKAAGYSVAWGGKTDPNNDPKGVRGAGLNNIYPYFTK